MKGISSPEGRNRSPKLTINIEKNQQHTSKPKTTSPRNKIGTVGMFPPIVEEQLVSKSKQTYAMSPRSVDQNNQEFNSVPNNQDSPPISPAETSTARRMSLNNGLLRNVTSLKSMGKFSTVLKAKMAFKSRTKKKSIGSVVEDEEDVIVELPKEPRFSTTMSPEAQYAIMKGYEDTVYNYLCKEYPEHKLLLRRSKTPITKVDPQTKNETRNMNGKKDQNSSNELSVKTVSAGRESSYASQDASDDNCLSGNALVNPPSSANMSRRASMPVASMSFKKFGRSGSFSSTSGSLDLPLSKAESLPCVIPREKQLILSYRLQSAMDILDTVRDGVGDCYTSPRVRASINRNIKPVLDYNKWTGVWGKDFKDMEKAVHKSK